MKYKAIILLLICTQLSFAQTIDFKLFKYNGLEFYLSKSEIKEKLGNPHKTFEPNYECGFLSADEQSTEYFTLDYGTVKFTGNENEKYLIELINFENDETIVLKYGEHSLTRETTMTELALIFGEHRITHYDNDKNGRVMLY